jgi:hypothetical protein
MCSLNCKPLAHYILLLLLLLLLLLCFCNAEFAP